MKRIVFVLFMLAAASLMATADSLQSCDYKQDGITYSCVFDAEVIDVDKDVVNANIPDKIIGNGYEYTVIGIEDGAFAYSLSMQSVTIPESVIEIGNFAFNGCESLSQVVVPKQVKQISNGTFANCSSLKTLKLANKVTSIGDFAFYNCAALTTIYFSGTANEWWRIAKGESWSQGIQSCTVFCSDKSIRIIEGKEQGTPPSSISVVVSDTESKYATIRSAYKTPDLQMEQLKGDVKSIKYSSGSINNYTPDGWRVIERENESVFVTRNEEGQLLKLNDAYDMECGGSFLEWSYDDCGFLRMFSYFLCETIDSIQYIYNENYELEKEMFYGDNLDIRYFKTYYYSNYKYDSHGNWISRYVVWDMKPDTESELYYEFREEYDKTFKDSGSYTETREISYYTGQDNDVEVVIAPPVEAPVEEEEEIFIVVETMPEFPGGQQEMMKYIGTNIKYPVIAQENGIQGRVICQFVVEKDGKVTNIKVVRSSSDASLDEEAVRVINSMPKWKPGKQRGKLVRVKYTIPVNFRLQ